jgi:aspartyl-tRNA(Asn)/glutamyl-tRNA(Gln) amidotransferase subunit A
MASFGIDGLTVSRLLADYRAGTLAPSEVVGQVIDRAEHDDALGAYLALNASARSQARRSDTRWRSGEALPLDGIPFAVKDVIQTDTMETTFGSADFAHFRPTITADVVRRLEGAGAVCIGKLATYEFAAGPNDRTRNPWAADRMSGGSSSGAAAAVGGGLIPLAIGTDTGGSIRVPAAWCGAVGLKPTLGRVSTHGVAPLSWTLDHVGPLTTTARDADLALRVMACQDRPYGPGDRPVERADVAGLRIGVPTTWFFDWCEPGVLDAVRAAVDRIAELGARVVEVDIPLLTAFNPDIVKHVLVGAEAAAYHRSRRERWMHYSSGLRDSLLFGESLGAVEYVEALRMRSVVAVALAEAFADIDVMVTPTSGLQAPLTGTTTVEFDGVARPLGDVVARNTSVFNLSGSPALTVPCGQTPDGLPVGLQIAAPAWREGAALAVGIAYQESAFAAIHQ